MRNLPNLLKRRAKKEKILTRGTRIRSPEMRKRDPILPIRENLSNSKTLIPSLERRLK